MINTSKLRIFCLLFTLGIFVCLSGTIKCFAQEEESKSIQSVELIKKRPPAKSLLSQNAGLIARKPSVKSNKNEKPKKRFYRVVKTPRTKPIAKAPVKAAPKGIMDGLLGFTVWKHRPATETDAAKELVEEKIGGKVQNSEYTLERMGLDVPLAIGEKIRLSIESLSHSGYLYVVNRELYSDGTYGVPKLIYPTLQTNSRNSPVEAGDLIFIPESSAKVFTVKANQSEKKQVGEILTVIISPKILIDESMLKTKAIDLPMAQFTSWLKQWEVNTTLFEQEGSVGQTITPVEQTAGQDVAKGLVEEPAALTQDDPLPQSVFRSKVKRGNPMLVNVLLNFRSN
jgi:hypothetical protein